MSFDFLGLCLGEVSRCEPRSRKWVIAVMSNNIVLCVVFVASRCVTINRFEYLGEGAWPWPPKGWWLGWNCVETGYYVENLCIWGLHPFSAWHVYVCCNPLLSQRTFMATHTMHSSPIFFSSSLKLHAFTHFLCVCMWLTDFSLHFPIACQ